MKLRYLWFLPVLLWLTSPVLAHSSSEPIPTQIALANLLTQIGTGLSAALIGYWLPALRIPLTTRLKQLVFGGWLLIGLAGLLVLIFRANFTGYALPDLLTTPFVLGANSLTFGTLWLISMGLWLVGGGLLWFALKSSLARWGVILIFSIALGATVFYTHEPSLADRFDVLLAGVFSQLALAVIFGGMALFIVLNQQPRKQRPPMLEPRLLHSARLPLLVIVIAGLYEAWTQLRVFAALPTTLHGQVLLIQLATLLPVAIVGIINFLQTERSDPRHNWIMAELALVAGASLIFGGIALINPTRTAQPWQELAVEYPAYETTIVNGLSIDLQVSPDRQGDTPLYVVLIDGQTGIRLDDATITIQLSHTAYPELDLLLRHTGDAIYTATNAALGTVGDWQAVVTVQRPNQPETTAIFNYTIFPAPAPPTLAEAASQVATLGLILTLVLAGLAGLGYGGFSFGQARQRAIGLLSVGGALLFIVLILINQLSM